MEIIELRMLGQGTSSTLRAMPGLGLKFSLALGPVDTLSSSTFLANSTPVAVLGSLQENSKEKACLRNQLVGLPRQEGY